MNIKSNLLPYLRGIGLALWMGVILSFSVVGQTPDHSSSDVQPASELPSASDALEPKITATTANPPTAPLTFVWRIHELSKGAFIEPSLMVEVAEEANDPSDPKPKSPIVSNPSDPVADPQFESTRRFDWNAALKQSFYFNTLLHGVRLAIEPDVRAELGGPFFKEYLRSVKSLRGWDDGDNFLTNYVGHPMQGAVSGRIQIHNEPKGRKQEFGLRKEYFKSRFRAMGFAAMFSANFELGLMSEASIGNVGMKPREKAGIQWPLKTWL